mgnify:FL=1
MFLFIFESLGTSELLLIGIVALIFLGPRRLPEIARKIGKMMAEFRSTANEFKETWEREVDLEEERKALDLDLIEEEAVKPVARENCILGETAISPEIETPAIKQIDQEQFEAMKAESGNVSNGTVSETGSTGDEPDVLSDKRNWL